MAVAIPIIMSAAGAATWVTVAVSLAATVTGVSTALNKAAADVIGEDAVQAFSMLGTVFGGQIADGLSGALGGAATTGAVGGEALAEGLAEGAASGVEGSAAFVGPPADASAFVGPPGILAEATGMPASEAVAATASPTPTQTERIAATVVEPNPTDTRLAAGTQTTPSSAATAANQGTNVVKKISEGGEQFGKFWKGLDPTTKQLIGYGTMGVLQGVAKAKMAKEERDYAEKVRQDERTGSHLRYGDDYTYRPASPVRRG
jgi:hypothetical protein